MISLLFKSKNIKKAGKIFVVLVLCFNLSAYHLFVGSVMLARADETSEEEVLEETETGEGEDDEQEEEEEGESEEGSEEEEEGTGEENNGDEEEDEEGEESNNERNEGGESEDEEENGEETLEGSEMKTTLLGDDNCEEGENCEEEDPEIVVENENEVVVENEVSTESNTGENQIGEEPAQEEDGECEGECCMETEGGSECGGDEEKNIEGSENESECQEGEILGENGLCMSNENDQNNDEEGENGEEGEKGEEEEEGEGAIQNEENSESMEDGEENSEKSNEEEVQAEIDTGDAVAQTDVYNEANTNVVGANWIELVINIFEAQSGDINLLEIFKEILENYDDGSLFCDEECQKILVENENNAEIINAVTTVANSGDNSIYGTEGEMSGDALIETGDAVAVSNVVNVVNQNFVGYNWLFAVINILGYWEGDLIVPGEGLYEMPYDQTFAIEEVENNNEADVENEVKTTANTGGNEIVNADQAIEETGDAQSSSAVLNVANTNIIENNWFGMQINNLGSWLGGVANWQGDLATFLKYYFGVGEENEIGILLVKNNNTASVTNTVATSANSGGNLIDDADEASIKTGDAGAFSNVVNYINTNIIGNNWMFVVVNILGTWKGNAEFAYPDLAVNIDDGKDQVNGGEQLSYSLQYANLGKADAEEVDIELEIRQEDNGNVTANQSYVWTLPGLKAGETSELKINFGTNQNVIGGLVTAKANISTGTKEVEKSNNESDDTTAVLSVIDEGDGANNANSEENDNNKTIAIEEYEEEVLLEVERKEMDKEVYGPGEIIEHTIYVRNEGDVPLYEVELDDKIRFNSEFDLMEYTWPIGDLDAGKGVKVKYSLMVNLNIPSGQYRHSAVAKGIKANGKKVRSEKVRVTVEINNPGFYGYYNEQSGEEPFELVSVAQAQEQEIPPVLGASYMVPERNMPIWFWIGLLAAYMLAINWSFFPGNGHELGRFRKVVVPVVYSAMMVLAWLLFSGQSAFDAWFMPIAGMLFLSQYYYADKQKIKRPIKA